jgi:nucleoside-diphosphate-sugar epimerase
MTWAILGCGYVGARLLGALEGAGESVLATTRQPARAAVLGPAARVVDVRDVDALAAVLSPGVIVVDSIPTDAAGPHMGSVVAAAARSGAARIVYLSATSVFGAHQGSWIDEDTAIAPDNPRGRARVAEEELLFAGRVEAVALRIAAIYGPGRGLAERLRSGTYQVVGDGSGYVSRIHVDDLVQVIWAAGTVQPLARRAYVVGDDEPSTIRAHADGVAAALGLPPPPSVPRAEAPPLVAEMQTGGRRVRNARMKSELGVSLLYPTWRDGLRAHS